MNCDRTVPPCNLSSWGRCQGPSSGAASMSSKRTCEGNKLIASDFQALNPKPCILGKHALIELSRFAAKAVWTDTGLKSSKCDFPMLLVRSCRDRRTFSNPEPKPQTQTLSSFHFIFHNPYITPISTL